MKNTSLLMLFVLIFSLVLFCNSCSNPSTTNETSKDLTSTPIEITVEEILSLFDTPPHYIQEYDKEMIEGIETNINQDLTHSGEISRIIHIATQANESERVWAYVYEFSVESDANSFEKNRSMFVSDLENGRCIRLGNIVIFGNSIIISTILPED